MAGKQTGIIADRVSEFSCVHCGNILDVSEISSFTKIKCPECGGAQRVPAQLGHFLLLEPLGAGGMGVIYRAVDQTLGRYVALKVMKKSLGDNSEFVESFRREAQAAAALNHKNVVQIYSFGQEKGQPYIVMELVDGGRLDKMIEGGKQLGEVKSLEIHIEVTDGLNAASEAGLVHGDVKPANILFGKNGEAKVVDFGLASFIGQQESQSGEIWGTPYFIAPEKAKGKPADFRSDIYSLGGTLFQVLTGEPPFDGDTPLDVVLARLNRPAPPVTDKRPDITKETSAMIARMLEMEPSLRYPSYPALLADMRAALNIASSRGGRSSKAVNAKPKASKKTNASGKSKKALMTVGIALGAVVLLGAAVFGGIYWKQKADAEESRQADERRLTTALGEVGSLVSSMEALLGMIRVEVSTNVAPMIDRIERVNAPEADAVMLDIYREFDNVMIAEADARVIATVAGQVARSAQGVTDADLAVELAQEMDKLRSEMTKRFNRTLHTKEFLQKKLPEAEALQREANTRIARERQAERERRQEELKAKQDEERKKRDAAALAKELEALTGAELERVASARSDAKKLLEEYRFADALEDLQKFAAELRTDKGKADAENLVAVYRTLAQMKSLVIRGFAVTPYSFQLSSVGQPREIRQASDTELVLAAPGGGSMNMEWKTLTVPQFLRMANAYAENTNISVADRSQIMLGIALFCNEMSSFKLARQFAAKAVQLNSDLQARVDRLMPDLQSQE